MSEYRYPPAHAIPYARAYFAPKALELDGLSKYSHSEYNHSKYSERRRCRGRARGPWERSKHVRRESRELVGTYTHSLTQTPRHSLAHSLPRPRAHPRTHSRTTLPSLEGLVVSPTHLPTHSLTYSLTHLLTYSLTHLLTYSLTHSLTVYTTPLASRASLASLQKGHEVKEKRTTASLQWLRVMG